MFFTVPFNVYRNLSIIHLCVALFDNAFADRERRDNATIIQGMHFLLGREELRNIT